MNKDKNDFSSFGDFVNGNGDSPKPFDPSAGISDDTFNGSTTAVEEKTLMDTINAIERKDTNYIFLFGRPATGKSYITASMIYYMKNSKLGDLNLSPTTSRESQLLFDDLYDNFGTGKIIDRTNATVTTPYELDLVFTPKDSRLPPMKITFLEMSGENLQKVQILRNDPNSGKLSDDIDIYFLCHNIKLIFFLVADHEHAAEDSKAIDKFLQYVFHKDIKFNNANYLLAITKWDTYNGRHKKIEGFTTETMPNIHNRLINESVGNAITHYSIGKILTRNVNGVDTQLIQEINTERADSVTKWLYKTITKKSLVPEPSAWEKFLSFMGFNF